jgi:hypothetical protein
MRRPMLLAAALTALLLFPAAATAKGPSAATIAGPGLAHMLTINGYGEGGDSSPLGILVSEAGFFPQVYGATPAPTTSRPAGTLGQRYDVTYTMPGPNGDSTLRQALYPYAANGPASYMAPGQKFWDTQSTLGGWYRGTATLRAMLVKAGLPATAPTKRAARGQAHTRAVAVGAGAGIATAAGALGLLYWRRRSARR